MNFLLRNSGQNSRQKRFSRKPIAVVFVCVLFIALIFKIFPNFFSSIFIPIFSSAWKSTSTQNEDLERRLASLQSAETQIATLTNENNDLKVILGRSVAKKPILATVLRKPPYTAYDTVIVDAGKNAGVSVGDLVFALGNIIVGKVSEVYSDYSKVTLFSTQGEKYEVSIGSHNIQATATGRGGGTYEIILPRDSGVVVGDIVTAPSMIPSTFGTVGAIVDLPAQAFKFVLVNLPINITELRFVEIEPKSSFHDDAFSQ